MPAMATKTTKTAQDARPTVVAPKPRLRRVGSAVLQRDGHPSFGARHGIVGVVDWDGISQRYALGGVEAHLRHKRWVYVVASTEQVQVAAAIVDAGAAATAFVMVTDLATGEVLVDSSRPGGLGPMVTVGEKPGEGLLASYRLPGTEYAFAREEGSSETTFRIRLADTFNSLPGLHSIPIVSQLPGVSLLPTGKQRPWVEIDLTLEHGVTPGLTAVSAVRGERTTVTATVKTAALPGWGEIRVHGDKGKITTISLDGAMGGYDYTNGFLPRRTQWKWAYGTGRLADGRTFGLNLVSGFTGIDDKVSENVLWLDGDLVPITSPVRIVRPGDASQTWTARTLDGSLHLAFVPIACHRESLNLAVIQAELVQPAGHFSGHVTVDGERVDVNRIPGVVEDQDALW